MKTNDINVTDNVMGNQSNRLSKVKQSVWEKLNKFYVTFLFITISIGMFQFGFCLSSWNSMQLIFQCKPLPYIWQPWYVEAITSITVFGAMISSLGTGYLTQYGKWRLLHFSNLLLIIASGLSLLDIIEIQMVARFFYGIAAGSFTVICPKFINETAP